MCVCGGGWQTAHPCMCSCSIYWGWGGGFLSQIFPSMHEWMHGQQQGAGCVPQMVMMDDDDCPFGDPSLGLRVFHSNDTKDDRYMTPQGRSTVSRSVQKQGRKSCIYLIHQNKGNRFKSRIVRLIPYHV